MSIRYHYYNTILHSIYNEWCKQVSIIIMIKEIYSTILDKSPMVIYLLDQ